MTSEDEPRSPGCATGSASALLDFSQRRNPGDGLIRLRMHLDRPLRSHPHRHWQSQWHPAPGDCSSDGYCKFFGAIVPENELVGLIFFRPFKRVQRVSAVRHSRGSSDSTLIRALTSSLRLVSCVELASIVAGQSRASSALCRCRSARRASSNTIHRATDARRRPSRR